MVEICTLWEHVYSGAGLVKDKDNILVLLILTNSCVDSPRLATKMWKKVNARGYPAPKKPRTTITRGMGA